MDLCGLLEMNDTLMSCVAHAGSMAANVNVGAKMKKALWQLVGP